MCWIGGGSEITWPFLILCGISLWVKKGNLNWGLKQEILLKTPITKKFLSVADEYWKFDTL